MNLAARRQFFAEEVDALANLKTPGLLEALSAVPREAFLGAGPWLVQGEFSAPRRTPDADPRHVYHNYSIAIDPDRQLFNGSPAFLASVIDMLTLRPGDRLLHVGAGPGYYTAVMATVVGPGGRVVAIEVDPALAAAAGRNLAAMPWIDVREGDGTNLVDDRFDAILVNAGVTHPVAAWLDGLVSGGRLVIPLTATMPAMGPIGKGFMVLIEKEDEAFRAQPFAMTAIYSAIGLREDALNQQLGRALMRAPRPSFTRLRRDAHDPDATCWLHGDGFCFSAN